MIFWVFLFCRKNQKSWFEKSEKLKNSKSRSVIPDFSNFPAEMPRRTKVLRERHTYSVYLCDLFGSLLWSLWPYRLWEHHLEPLGSGLLLLLLILSISIRPRSERFQNLIIFDGTV